MRGAFMNAKISADTHQDQKCLAKTCFFHVFSTFNSGCPSVISLEYLVVTSLSPASGEEVVCAIHFYAPLALASNLVTFST